MVDMDEMMDKVNNINSRVEKLYSKAKEAVNSDCYLKSCIAQQAKEITELTRQVDNQKDTIKNMGDNLIAIAKERDNLAASLEAEKEHAKACNNNFYDYRLSTTATIKGYQQELEKVGAERDGAKADVKVLNKNHQALGEQYNDLMRKYDEVRSERDTAKALNEQLHADFDVLAKNHKELGEQYSDLRLKYENADCRIAKLRDELKDREVTIKMLKDDLEEVGRLKIELATVKQELGDQLYYRDAEIKSLKETISNLKTEIKYSKTRYVDKTIEFNRLSKESLNLKGERDALTKELAKYSWKRVDRSEPLPFEDHELYLFAIDGYSTPVKGKFHDDSLSNISIIVDDGDGKGPVYKVLFFMDGHIRYWTPLPEMPDMPKGGNDDD